jgi:hypothetical protein
MGNGDEKRNENEFEFQFEETRRVVDLHLPSRHQRQAESFAALPSPRCATLVHGEYQAGTRKNRNRKTRLDGGLFASRPGHGMNEWEVGMSKLWRMDKLEHLAQS